MSKIKEQCIEFNEIRKVCIASENGKTYRLENDSNFKVRKVKVDKCIPQGLNEARCDFLMSIDQEGELRVFFIELKGGDLRRALEQVYDTVIYLTAEFKGYKKEARIVGSRDVPKFLSSSEYKKLAKEILATKGTIERATNKIYTEKI